MQDTASSRPFVHVGYHKTGTTWLQHNFFPLVTSHAMVPRPIIKRRLLDPPGLTFDAAQAREGLLEASGGKPPLISEENLSGGIHGGGMNGLVGPECARRLRATFPDANIIIAIRAQPALIASAYSSYVDAGGTFGPHRYVFPADYPIRGERERTKARFNLAHLEFDRLIAYYGTLFGSDNVHVIVYEKFRRNPVATARWLAAATGLEVDSAAIDAATVNQGFSAARIAMTRKLNLFLRGGVDEKTSIANVPGVRRLRNSLWRLDRISQKPSPEKMLGPAIIETVVRYYADSNDRLRAMGIDLDGLGYP